MSDPIVARLQEWLRAHEQDLLNDTVALLRIPSIESQAEPNAPFGAGNREALNQALSTAAAWGMAVTDLEGYVGYAEVGQGEKLVVSLGHLDVVPVGPGWKHEPFGATVEDGYIYARGACDDKGPSMAALYAARAIKECIPDLPGRLRCVFGCNEESGMACVHRYLQTEEMPTYGVAPDAGWPLYHAEKGIVNLVVEAPAPNGDMELLEIVGGQRPNIVIDTCSARVRVSTAAREAVAAKVSSGWDRNVSASWEGQELWIEAVGHAAHGAEPYNGDSAAIRVLRFLMEVSPDSTKKAYGQLFSVANPSGEGLGAAYADRVSGPTSCNLGIVALSDGKVKMTYNLRYPVTAKGDEVKAGIEKKLAKLEGGFALASFSGSAPLYFPLDHPMVKAICEVHAEETGETKEPGAMGGGTYARLLPNTVSIGTGWEGDGPAHETDERLKVEHLFRMSRIYAHIFWRLLNL